MVTLGKEILSRIQKINFDLSNIQSVYDEFKMSYLSANIDKNEFDFVKNEIAIFRELLNREEISKEIEIGTSKLGQQVIPVIPYQIIPDIGKLLNKKIYAYYRILEINKEDIDEMELFYKHHFASVFFDRSKSFSFFKIICFDEEYFVDVQKGIDSKEKLYNYILYKLDNKEDQIRFKGDFLDNLKELITSQKHTKFKIYLEELYFKIKEAKVPFQNQINQSRKVQNNVLEDSIIAENYNFRIFKSEFGCVLFNKLVEEIGKTGHDIANYSFIYHRMIKDNLIYETCKHKEYTNYLSEFDIHITRLKSLQELGNIDDKKRKYDAIKQSL